MPKGIYIRTEKHRKKISRGHLNSSVAIQASRNNILIAIEASSKLLRSEKQIMQLKKLHKLPKPQNKEKCQLEI